jgi:hypothetical protein
VSGALAPFGRRLDLPSGVRSARAFQAAARCCCWRAAVNLNGFTRFLDDGRIELDTNSVERSMHLTRSIIFMGITSMGITSVGITSMGYYSHGIIFISIIFDSR